MDIKPVNGALQSSQQPKTQLHIASYLLQGWYFPGWKQLLVWPFSLCFIRIQTDLRPYEKRAMEYNIMHCTGFSQLTGCTSPFPPPKLHVFSTWSLFWHLFYRKWNPVPLMLIPFLGEIIVRWPHLNGLPSPSWYSVENFNIVLLKQTVYIMLTKKS